MTITYLPSSIYLGGASGSVYPAFYIPNTNTNLSGAMEGVGVIASLTSSTSPYNAVLQFNLATTSTGALTLRTLTWANATTGNAKWTAVDGVTATGASMGVTALTTEAQASVTCTAADLTYATSTVLASAPTSSGILTVNINFNSTGAWTLAAASVWQFSVTQ